MYISYNLRMFIYLVLTKIIILIIKLAPFYSSLTINSQHWQILGKGLLEDWKNKHQSLILCLWNSFCFIFFYFEAPESQEAESLQEKGPSAEGAETWESY